MNDFGKIKLRIDIHQFFFLVLILLIGSMTPIHEIGRTFRETIERLYTEEPVYEPSSDLKDIFNGRNFSGPTDHSFFFKYIAK